MLYFANPSTQLVRDAMMECRKLGMINTPAQGSRILPGVIWCADNGCYGEGYPGDAKWIKWLHGHSRHADLCAFATAPDVVGDGEGTLKRSIPLLPVIRQAGFPAALVLQDGMSSSQVPWAGLDAVFIGGTTDWKLSDEARRLADVARSKGKWVHMGRVNSRKRIRIARSFGCDSADGTYLAFGPQINLPKLLGWLGEDE